MTGAQGDVIEQIVWAFVARCPDDALNDDPAGVIARTKGQFERGGYAALPAIANEFQVPWPPDSVLLATSAAAGRARWFSLQRDLAVRTAIEGGRSLREVGAAVGLSHEQVRRIALGRQG